MDYSYHDMYYIRSGGRILSFGTIIPIINLLTLLYKIIINYQTKIKTVWKIYRYYLVILAIMAIWVVCHSWLYWLLIMQLQKWIFLQVWWWSYFLLCLSYRSNILRNNIEMIYNILKQENNPVFFVIKKLLQSLFIIIIYRVWSSVAWH